MRRPQAGPVTELIRGEAVVCHIVRSTTVNDGSPWSRCPDDLGSRYGGMDLNRPGRRSRRPYKAVVIGGPLIEQVAIKVAMPLRPSPVSVLRGFA